MKPFLKLSLVAVAAATLAACSPFATNPQGVDYRSATQGEALAVPPDLTRMSSETRYVMPESANEFGARQQSQRSGEAATALTSAGDVRIESAGTQQWLVVQRTPEQLWDPVRTFWENNGFVLSTADRSVGIMETDWAENRANIPMDPIRRTLGKVMDSLYSTGQIDRYRTRVEANPKGGTNIYITQRGMQEILTGRDKESVTWVERPNDPGLESEMMRRLMIALGLPQEQANALSKQAPARAAAPAPVAAAKAAATPAPAASHNGQLHVAAQGAQAWQAVGLALDRSGFTIARTVQNSGQYVLNYVPPMSTAPEKKSSWLGGLFSSKTPPAPEPTTYVVQLTPAANGTTISVLDAQGQATNNADSQRILNVLAKELR